MENYRKYTIRELKLEDEDLMMNVTMGLVISGTCLDLLRLKKQLSELTDFRVTYNTISTSHLRVVKVNEYEDYLAWRRTQNE